jgi:ABC-type antimicrobial peptide transport system permease subunit
MGKVPSALKKTIFVEYDNYLRWIADYLPEPLNSNQDFAKYLKKTQTSMMDEFADQLVLTLPSPRSMYYLQPFDNVMSDIMTHMSFVEESLGYFPVTVEAYIMQDFKMAHLSVTFLQLIFNLVMLLLFMISILLIYSLLMLSVESKSFEFGVMRMVGLSKNNVMALVVM